MFESRGFHVVIRFYGLREVHLVSDVAVSMTDE